MTRAKKKLFITYLKYSWRQEYKCYVVGDPSRFLSELPSDIQFEKYVGQTISNGRNSLSVNGKARIMSAATIKKIKENKEEKKLREKDLALKTKEKDFIDPN